jgi:CMP-N-acetylneuraminic acid synthetase
MIAWTIEAALSTSIFERVIVTTDDEGIAEVARTWGAEVPFLRDRFADDESPVSEATTRALEQLDHHDGTKPEIVVQLMPNCPLRGGEIVADALGAFSGTDALFQISCVRFGWMNPWWAVKLDSAQRPEPVFKCALRQRSQDLPPLYCPTGAVWIASAPALREARTFYGSGHIFHPMPWQAAVDIDDAEDLAFAEAVAQAGWLKLPESPR